MARTVYSKKQHLLRLQITSKTYATNNYWGLIVSVNTFSRALAALAMTALTLGCSEKAPEVTAVPEEPAQEVAIQELETQPATEIDATHISPKLLETYKKTCASCHEAGVVGAPKTGDVDAWKPRLAKGMDTMVTHAREGFNTMPPAGLCFSCSDEDYAALITYMSTAR